MRAGKNLCMRQRPLRFPFKKTELGCRHRVSKASLRGTLHLCGALVGARRALLQLDLADFPSPTNFAVVDFLGLSFNKPVSSEQNG